LFLCFTYIFILRTLQKLLTHLRLLGLIAGYTDPGTKKYISTKFIFHITISTNEFGINNYIAEKRFIAKRVQT